MNGLCGETFQFPINTQFHTLLTQSEVYSETPREKSHKGSFNYDDNHGFETDDDFDDGFEEDDDEDGEPMDFNSSDFEVTVVKDPIADLKEILHEQIMLILPMQPKHPPGECKGKSPQWHNEEPLKENPFSILKNFKKKS